MLCLVVCLVHCGSLRRNNIAYFVCVAVACGGEVFAGVVHRDKLMTSHVERCQRRSSLLILYGVDAHSLRIGFGVIVLALHGDDILTGEVVVGSFHGGAYALLGVADGGPVRIVCRLHGVV